jgi:ribosomal protein L9
VDSCYVRTYACNEGKRTKRSTKVEAQFDATLQAEREEAARKHEQLEAQKETNALLRAVLKL